MGKGASSKGRVKHMGAMGMQSHEELRDYMAGTYGVVLDTDSMRNINFEVERKLSAAIGAMLEEFPGINGKTITVDGRMRGDTSYAGTTVNGEIMLQPGIFGSEALAQAAYQHDLNQAYHPKGTNYVSTIIHEMGHQIEGELLRRRIPGDTRRDRMARSEAWRKGTVATEIVGRALDRVAPEWKSNPQVATDHIGRISAYASVDASETVAEAISDYYSNRGRAQPLSKAIWKIAKQELG